MTEKEKEEAHIRTYSPQKRGAFEAAIYLSTLTSLRHDTLQHRPTVKIDRVDSERERIGTGDG